MVVSIQCKDFGWPECTLTHDTVHICTNELLQVETSCSNKINFVLEFTSTSSQQMFISSATFSEGQQNLTLLSNEIQLNECYNVTVTVEGTSTFQRSLSKSKPLIIHSINTLR